MPVWAPKPTSTPLKEGEKQVSVTLMDSFYRAQREVT